MPEFSGVEVCILGKNLSIITREFSVAIKTWLLLNYCVYSAAAAATYLAGSRHCHVVTRLKSFPCSWMSSASNTFNDIGQESLVILNLQWKSLSTFC